MPKSTLIKSRQSAFAAQGGNCNYCGHPMWESQPEKFSQVHGVRLRQVWRFKCTAEHLVPRESGGRDSKDNIVAACAYCNFQRHRARPARDPEAHRAHVQRRLAKGRWHSTTGYILSQT
ncbi:HNH endonuclease [Arenimonas caeni]|uniref:Restriction endonuclease n=1 Tax=Arenimonas caeni TaxID=2058085 RepID=A0A2P6M5R1_9GAMM|nr:restriction endonuclease [Arenimonas caeni]